MVAYRFDPDYAIEGRHYAHSLVDWPSVIAGAVAAIAVGFALNVLGVAIGAAAFDPVAFNTQDESLSLGAGLYVMFAQFIAFQAGAYVAARSARYPDHFGGLLSGAMVWALATTSAVVLAALTAGAVAGGDALDAGAADTIGELSAATDGAVALSALAWWTAGALALGFCGAVAGGWLGAHHPKWEARPRYGAPYQSPRA